MEELKLQPIQITKRDLKNLNNGKEEYKEKNKSFRDEVEDLYKDYYSDIYPYSRNSYNGYGGYNDIPYGYYEGYNYLPGFSRYRLRNYGVKAINEIINIHVPAKVFELLAVLSEALDTEVYIELPIKGESVTETVIEEKRNYKTDGRKGLIKYLSDRFGLRKNRRKDNATSHTIKSQQVDVYVKPEVYIPDQYVTEASVDIETGLGYNVLGIHIHPGNLSVFSGTDEQSINQKVKYSAIVPEFYLENNNFTFPDFRKEGKKPKKVNVVLTNEPIMIADLGEIKVKMGKIDATIPIKKLIKFIENKSNIEIDLW